MKWVYISLFVVVLLIALLFARLAWKPISLGDGFLGLQEKFQIAGYEAKFQKLNFYFNGKFVVEAEEGRWEFGEQDLGFEKATVELASGPLFLGKIRPKHVDISGLYLPHITLVENEAQMGPFTVPLKGDDNKKSLVTIINDLDDNVPFISRLKSLKLTRFDVLVEDVMNRKKWRINPIELRLDKSFLNGENLNIETRLHDIANEASREIPVKITASHGRMAEDITFEIQVKELNTEELKPYFTNPNLLSGKVDGWVKVLIDNENNIFDFHSDISLSNGSLFLNNLYDFPFKFKTLKAKIDGHDDLSTINIEEIKATDDKGWPFEISGKITHLFTDNLQVNIALNSLGETTVIDMNRYLPSKKIAGVTKWINNNVGNSTVKNLKLAYNGNPLKIPQCPKGCGFDGSFDFENMQMQFLNTLQMAENMNGHFTMKNGRIDIKTKSGQVGEQQLRNAHVEIFDFFDKNKPTTLSAKGEITGETVKLLKHIEGIVPGSEPWNVDISGTHITNMFLSIPLFTPQFEFITLRTETDIKEAKSEKYVKGHTLYLPSATAVVEKNVEKNSFTMAIDGKGFFDEQPAVYSWKEDLNNTFEKTNLTASSILPYSEIEPILTKAGIQLNGDVPVRVIIDNLKEQPQKVRLILDFTNHEVSFLELNWLKPKDEELVAILDLFIDTKTGGIDLVNVLVQGDDVDIEGEIKEVDSAQPHVYLNKLNLGKSKVKASFVNGQLSIIGQVLDISKKDFKNYLNKENIAEASKDSTFKTNINVEQLLLKNGLLNNFILDMVESKTGGIQTLNVSAIGAENAPFNIAIKKSDSLKYSYDIEAMSANLGNVLKTTDIYHDLHKGQFNLTGQFNLNGTAVGTASIKSANLTKVPLLFKLFSVLSVEDLFTFEKGVRFDSIQIPLEINENEYIFSNLTMKGPSVNLRMRGKLGKDDSLMVKGQLIPISRLNKLVNKIPLFGDIITGSQKGLLVADFDIGGTLQNPKISSNPFSFITPGILKDAWGIVVGEGEDPAAPTVNKTPHTQIKLDTENLQSKSQ